MTIIDIEADGNCLFRSLSDQLYYDYGHNHVQVRTEVCDFMAHYKGDFSNFVSYDDQDDDPNEDNAKNYEDYLQTMRQDGAWGGNVELCAAARLYRYVTNTILHRSLSHTHTHCTRRDITLYSSSSNKYTIGHGSTKPAAFREMLLSYHDNEHYNSVRLTKGSQPPPPVKTFLTPKVEIVEDAMDIEVKSIRGTVVQESPATVPPQRNAACSCGSGLKYKKCCGARGKHKARAKKHREDREAAAQQEPKMEGEFRVLQI